jgi:hypothetical protein
MEVVRYTKVTLSRRGLILHLIPTLQARETSFSQTTNGDTTAQQARQHQGLGLSAAMTQLEDLLRRSRPALTRPLDAVSLFASDLMK